MQVLYTRQFAKEITKIKDKDLAGSIEKAILSVKNAASLSDIGDLKKLKGYRNAYRIRIGQYLIGIHAEGDSVEFACFMHRRDIYRYFP